MRTLLLLTIALGLGGCDVIQKAVDLCASKGLTYHGHGRDSIVFCKDKDERLYPYAVPR